MNLFQKPTFIQHLHWGVKTFFYETHLNQKSHTHLNGDENNNRKHF